MKISIFWFRRDLRLFDNTALHFALKSGFKVLPVFIFDQNILKELPKNDARLNFIYQDLQSINNEINKYKSSMLCLHGDPLEIWEKIIEKYDIAKVFINKDYEPYARERDLKIKKLLIKNGIEFHDFKDHVIFEENEIVKADGTPYTVFTPYKNKWLERFGKEYPGTFESSLLKNFLEFNQALPTLSKLGFEKSKIKVKDYSLKRIFEYGSIRDLPAEDGTSFLSPHLRFGTVSVRQIISKLTPADNIFLNELIWREFFMQILFHFPRVVNESFKLKYDGIKWRNSPVEFEKWCNGQTGYPMVDAGMRQLNETGYMHNRVRMVVASFLCKHLLIDWRWGEAYFAQKLLDYELSSNNGNWQWAAGTGCDATPYFRIFNPIEQLKKFDPDLIYIKRWIPEFGTASYPPPIVDHKIARERALKTYKTGLSNSW